MAPIWHYDADNADWVQIFAMKKAANCMSLAAFVMRYGGLGSIER